MRAFPHKIWKNAPENDGGSEHAVEWVSILHGAPYLRSFSQKSFVYILLYMRAYQADSFLSLSL